MRRIVLALLIAVTSAGCAAGGVRSGAPESSPTAQTPDSSTITTAPASSPTDAPESSPSAAPSPATGPQPGYVDIGGYSLYMECTGTGSPTVLFEAGAGSGTDTFDFVAPEIAERTTVCQYDRAGIGQSDMRPDDASPASAGDVADELERLLAAGGVEGHLVLVAHSFGGMVAQLFADRHRGDVVGLVFDDSSLAAQVTDDLKTWEDGWRGGLIDMQRTKTELEATRPYGETPMVVLTQNFVDNEEQYDKSQQRWWRRHQAALARRSTDSIHLIALDSGHVIQDQQPDLVVAAIDEVVDAVRQGEPLAPCDARFGTLGGVCIGQAPPP